MNIVIASGKGGTGENAISLFKEEYKDNFIHVKVGQDLEV